MARRFWTGRSKGEAEEARPLYVDSQKFISDFQRELKARKEEINKKLENLKKKEEKSD